MTDFDVARHYAHSKLDGDGTIQSWPLSRIMACMAIDVWRAAMSDENTRNQIGYSKWAEKARERRVEELLVL